METIEYDLGETLGIEDAKGVMFDGFKDEGNPYVREVDPDYVHRKEFVSDFVAWLKLGGDDGLYIHGPTGCGKSSGVFQVFANLKIPALGVTAHEDMEFSDLVGYNRLVDGDTIWIDGPLITAMRLGMPLVIDEMDSFDPSVAASLNGIFDAGMLTIPENAGEVVYAQPGFRIIATGNSAGNGDRTGLYQSVLRQNAAFMDRFWSIEVSYPPADVEKAILEEKAPNLPEWIRDKMIEVATELRALFVGEDEGPQIELPLSTRSLVRWACLTEAFQGVARSGKNPLIHAVDRAFANRAEPETRAAIHGIIERVVGHDVQFK